MITGIVGETRYNRTYMAKKLSGAGCRRKGTAAETEIVSILNSAGIPAQRVLASGAFVGAGADVKIGVELDSNGNMPDKDESKCVMRGEIKNRKDNPERLWTYLKQNIKNKAVILRRPKVPHGVIRDKNYDEVYLVCMGLDEWIKLFKKAYYGE